jgi:hypothetical protein
MLWTIVFIITTIMVDDQGRRPARSEDDGLYYYHHHDRRRSTHWWTFAASVSVVPEIGRCTFDPNNDPRMRVPLLPASQSTPTKDGQNANVGSLLDDIELLFVEISSSEDLVLTTSDHLAAPNCKIGRPWSVSSEQRFDPPTTTAPPFVRPESLPLLYRLVLWIVFAVVSRSFLEMAHTHRPQRGKLQPNMDFPGSFFGIYSLGEEFFAGMY